MKILGARERVSQPQYRNREGGEVRKDWGVESMLSLRFPVENKILNTIFIVKINMKEE